jgi:putative membrane protein
MSSSSSSATSGQLSSADKTFINKAAEGGLAEVQLGQLAKDKAQDQKVKDFGQRMVDDHTKANDQLKSLAKQKGVTLPTDMSAKDKTEQDRLSKLSGAQFDKAYMKYMVQDHTQDVSEFQKEARSAKDSDVKSFASSTLPTLQDHLKMAKSINPTGASAKSSSGSSSGMSASSSGSSGVSKKGSTTSASNPPQL